MTLTFDPAVSVGAMVREAPELMGFFDRRGLDYCCHGSDTLAEACRRAGIDATALRAELGAEAARIESVPRPAAQSVSALCDEIESGHHVRARELLDRLRVLLMRVVGVHGTRHPEYLELQNVFERLRAELIDHMAKEEQVLFPWLRQLDGPARVERHWGLRGPIACMMQDHVLVADAFQHIRQLTADFTVPADACGSVASLLAGLRDLEDDTRHHVHKENNVLFPAGLALEERRIGHGGSG